MPKLQKVLLGALFRRLVRLDDVELFGNIGVGGFLDPVEPGLVRRQNGLRRVTLVTLVAAQPMSGQLLIRTKN